MLRSIDQEPLTRTRHAFEHLARVSAERLSARSRRSGVQAANLTHRVPRRLRRSGGPR